MASDESHSSHHLMPLVPCDLTITEVMDMSLQKNGHGIGVSLNWYGVAVNSRIDKITGLFCKRALQKSQYSAKETYNFIDPTIRSHLIWGVAVCCMVMSFHEMTASGNIGNVISCHFICDLQHAATPHMGWLRIVGSIKL